ncbi:hypothetical protein BDR04DRAFT_1091951 [Suillus decipiens]|nr:hypothetical protein BDR04DRAFT_1091951 [Suillus decipiens]
METLNWSAAGRQTSYHFQHAPSTVHDERVLSFFQSAAYQPHNPNPYAFVSPASLTPDFDQSPPSYHHRDSPPSFSRPLSMTILNDPAFSSDPRVHPHFPLVSPTFYKELPSKSPLLVVSNPSQTSQTAPSGISPHQEVPCPIEDSDFVSHSPGSEEAHTPPTASTSVSLDSDSPTALSAFTSPTISSATSHSHSQLSFPFSASPVSYSSSPSHDPGSSPTMCAPASNRPTPTRIVSAPEQREKVVKPAITRSDSTPVHADGSNRPTRKRRMKNFIQRFTSSRALDRIEEIDESEPFRAGRQHGGPYEAIGSDLTQLGPAHMYNDIAVLRGDFHTKSKRENALRQVRTQKLPRLPPNGPDFVPGQIIPSGIISPPLHTSQANTVVPNPDVRNFSGQLEPSHPRDHQLPEAPSSRPSSRAPASKPASRTHRSGDNIPQQPGRDELAPYPLHQIHSAPGLPPGQNDRYLETQLQARGDANKATPFSSPPIVKPPDGQAIDLANLPRHRKAHSLDSSHMRTTTSTQSTSRAQNNLQPPRNHHLPKRLVMPALLQPVPQQQPPDIYPRANPHYARPDPDPDPFPPTKGYIHDPAVMYHQGRKLLRKKAAVFPGNIPLPTHVPGAHADSKPPLTKLSATNTEKVKEIVGRRRLSKRKHDI